jgi:hypothetical protein
MQDARSRLLSSLLRLVLATLTFSHDSEAEKQSVVAAREIQSKYQGGQSIPSN